MDKFSINFHSFLQYPNISEAFAFNQVQEMFYKE